MGVSSPRVFSLIWGGRQYRKRCPEEVRSKWRPEAELEFARRGDDVPGREREIHSGEAGGQSPDGENSKR